MSKTFEWDEKKNHQLTKERNISFEAIAYWIENGGLLAISEGKGKFKHQKQFLVEVNYYVYVVPYVEDNKKCFLKTIIPSRTMTKKYLSGDVHHEKNKS